MFAQVALNVPLFQTYTYHIPVSLQPSLQRGHLVRVAFGTSTQTGVVVALVTESSVQETKPIQAILDPLPVLNEIQLRVAEWISQHTLTPIGQAIWLWLPPALTGKSTRFVTLLQQDTTSSHALTEQVLSHLREHTPSKLADLERLFGQSVKKVLKTLQANGSITVESALSVPRVRPKTIKTAMLLLEEGARHKWRFSQRQAQVVDYLAEAGYAVDVPEVLTATSATPAILKALADKGVIGISERIVYRDSLIDRDYVATIPPELTAEQAQAWHILKHALHENPNTNGSAFLLHGVTGSGKTELYLKAIAYTLAQKRQVIFLVPEIALTPQTIRRVASRFPNQVAVVHSGLSTGERFDTWQRARKGEIGVIVGTRSALFTPLPDCGLVILDEEHDTSYKQSPPIQPPYYHARSVAERMMRMAHGTLILGSATPDLETYYRAQKGDLRLLSLPSRIIGHKERLESQAKRLGATLRYEPIGQETMALGLPPVQVIDMRTELKSGNMSMFSRALQTALQETHERNEQAILFLNRRGQATYVFCRDCGHVSHCSRCDHPLTYHRQGEALVCHHCGNRQEVPTHCPACGSSRIRYFGAGTQQVEEELLKLIPSVRVVRWDADTATKSEEHETILARFMAREADVIVGTQMIAKGLDLPLVTLVGVVSADTSLALPDFRATERAFQLLTQVSGRAGRGLLGGQVILQTYQPEHISVQSASYHHYSGFYAEAIAQRRALGYPPFRRLGRVLIQSTHPSEVQRHAEGVFHRLRHIVAQEGLTDTVIMGAVPCFFRKIDTFYRWQVLVRAIDPTQALRHLPYQAGQFIDIDPLDLL